jgi:hypothetical protein
MGLPQRNDPSDSRAHRALAYAVWMTAFGYPLMPARGFCLF